ncbi:MAG: type II secretion system protein [Candidatus Omnitrophota bacterium]
MRRKKAFTLVDLLIVSIVLGIISSMGWPIYNKIAKKMRFKEVKIMVDLVISGAKVYDMKCGIAELLNYSEEDAWDEIDVVMPVGREWSCSYRIADADDSGVTDGNIEFYIYSDPERDGSKTTLLYTYTLPYGGGVNDGANAGNTDAAYLPVGLP